MSPVSTVTSRYLKDAAGACSPGVTVIHDDGHDLRLVYSGLANKDVSS